MEKMFEHERAKIKHTKTHTFYSKDVNDERRWNKFNIKKNIVCYSRKSIQAFYSKRNYSWMTKQNVWKRKKDEWSIFFLSFRLIECPRYAVLLPFRILRFVCFEMVCITRIEPTLTAPPYHLRAYSNNGPCHFTIQFFSMLFLF